eukprot:767883-Hanusia_phi.AAC.3
MEKGPVELEDSRVGWGGGGVSHEVLVGGTCQQFENYDIARTSLSTFMNRNHEVGAEGDPASPAWHVGRWKPFMDSAMKYEDVRGLVCRLIEEKTVHSRCLTLD